MCDTTDSLNPRERLASKIQLRTNDGDDILDYLFEVFYEDPDRCRARTPGSGRAYPYQVRTPVPIRPGQAPGTLPRRKPQGRPRRGEGRRKARQDNQEHDRRRRGHRQIPAQYHERHRRNEQEEESAHNSRLAAARELLSRGYPPECDCAHRAASETEVVRSAADTGEQTTDSPEPSADAADNPEEQENIEEILAIIRRAAEETDPSEWEEEEASSPHKPDYSMWGLHRKPAPTGNHRRTSPNRSGSVLRSG